MTSEEALQFLKRNPVGVAGVAVALALGGWVYYRGDDGTALEEELSRRQADALRLGNNVKYAVQLNEQLAALQAANNAVVMSAIGEALVTTGLGIGVSIPAVVVYNAIRSHLGQRIKQSEALQRQVVAALPRLAPAPAREA